MKSYLYLNCTIMSNALFLDHVNLLKQTKKKQIADLQNLISGAHLDLKLPYGK